MFILYIITSYFSKRPDRICPGSSDEYQGLHAPAVEPVQFWHSTDRPTWVLVEVQRKPIEIHRVRHWVYEILWNWYEIIWWKLMGMNPEWMEKQTSKTFRGPQPQCAEPHVSTATRGNDRTWTQPGWSGGIGDRLSCAKAPWGLRWCTWPKLEQHLPNWVVKHWTSRKRMKNVFHFPFPKFDERLNERLLDLAMYTPAYACQVAEGSRARSSSSFHREPPSRCEGSTCRSITENIRK